MPNITLNKYMHLINDMLDDEQIRTNHNECGDTRRRLYIKRVGKYGAIAFCHNCQEKGHHSLNRSYKPDRKRRLPSYLTPLHERVPFPNTLDFFENFYLYLNHVDYAVCIDILALLEPYYDPMAPSKIDKVYYPIYMPFTKDVVGYNIKNRNNYPKHKRVIGSDFVGYQTYRQDAPTHTVVLCEDQISAATIGGIGHTGVCLFGVHSSIEKTHNIITRPEFAGNEFIVWLDNDNPTVKNQASKIAQYIGMLGGRVRTVQEKIEPKHLTKTEEINEHIQAAK